MILKGEQLREICRDIREQYIRGFNQVTRLDTYQLETSLELVEMGLVDDRGRQCECHPGRFCLHSDKRIYLKYTTSRCGGYPERSRKKHLKLDKIFL